MSVLENLKGRATAKLSSKSLASVISAANAELADLKSKHGAVALSVVEGAAGAERALADLNARIAVTRDHIATLQAAQRLVTEREQAEIVAQRANLHKAQINAVKRELGKRDQAAADLTEAFEKVSRAWKTMIEASRAAKAATPIGTQWPQDGLPDTITADGISRLVANEMFRQAGDPTIGNRASFPGSAPTPGNEGQPDKIVPLVAAMKAHTAFVLEKLTGKAPGA